MKSSRMKKFAVIGLSLLAILVIGVSIALAQEPAGGDTPAAPGANFVDEDNDGVCDLMGTGQSFGHGHGYGAGVPGANFVDEDNDGVCDLMGTGQGFGSQGQGGRGHGQGHGGGFGRGQGQGQGATATQ